MKSFCVSLLVVFALSASSQDKKFAVSSNILNLAALGPSVAFTYNATPRIGYQVYASQGAIWVFDYEFKTVIAEMRYTFWDYLYVGPYVRYIEKRVVRENEINSAAVFTVAGRNFYGKGISSGINLGFKYIDTKKVNLEAFAGLGYGRFIKQIDYDYPNDDRGGFPDARIGLLLGYKWGTINFKKN
ncbi:MAG TPA: DUF3575 domain-containing protein [Pedobacter sp.]